MTWGTAGDSRGANNSHGDLVKETEGHTSQTFPQGLSQLLGDRGEWFQICWAILSEPKSNSAKGLILQPLLGEQLEQCRYLQIKPKHIVGSKQLHI